MFTIVYLFLCTVFLFISTNRRSPCGCRECKASFFVLVANIKHQQAIVPKPITRIPCKFLSGWSCSVGSTAALKKSREVVLQFLSGAGYDVLKEPQGRRPNLGVLPRWSWLDDYCRSRGYDPCFTGTCFNVVFARVVPHAKQRLYHSIPITCLSHIIAQNVYIHTPLMLMLCIQFLSFRFHFGYQNMAHGCPLEKDCRRGRQCPGITIDWKSGIFTLNWSPQQIPNIDDYR